MAEMSHLSRLLPEKKHYLRYLYSMKTKTIQREKDDFLPNKERIIQDSVESLRSSFEIEGVFFTDTQIKAMADKVFANSGQAYKNVVPSLSVQIQKHT